jgi:hypothetical protein
MSNYQGRGIVERAFVSTEVLFHVLPLAFPNAEAVRNL